MSSSVAATAHRLRTGLLALAGLGVAGTAVELATIRHWDSLEQLIPWFVLAVLGGGIAAVAWRPSRSSAVAARIVGVVAVAGGGFGVLEHVLENLDAGPLDRTYGPRWDAMSGLSHLWAAVSGAVGPAPLLAPGVLAFIGLCLVLATLGIDGSSGRDALPSS